MSVFEPQKSIKSANAGINSSAPKQPEIPKTESKKMITRPESQFSVSKNSLRKNMSGLRVKPSRSKQSGSSLQVRKVSSMKKEPEFLNRAPFGIRTKRFACIGFHPDLDKSGAMKKDKHQLGPGQYDPQPHECAYKKYMFGGSPWTRKIHMEEFSRELGFKFPDVLEERRFTKTLGGPGTNDINYDLFKKQTSSNKKNCDFGSQKKFYSAIKNLNPPPDTYFRNIMRESSLAKKGGTPLPSFEWDGFVSRFKDTTKSWNIAPNRYSPVDFGSIETLLKRKVSKRGPYDLFTGPRDETTIKNHFSPGTFKGPENWFNTWPNEIDVLLHHPRKQKCGAFLKADRFPKHPSMRMMLNDLSLCYRNPDFPSPATYDIKLDNIKKLPDSKYPFNDSVIEARKGVGWKIHPGPGRYNVKYTKCKEKKHHSWVFKSKVQRNMYKVIDYKAF